MSKNLQRLPARLSVVGCVLLYASISGIGASCRGIFFSPIANELNISLSRLTAYYMFYGIASALATPMCCRIFQRFPISPVLTGMVVIYSTTIFLMGYANCAETFYLLAFVQGIVGGFLIYYPAQTIISQWFPEQKGTMLGFVLMSSGICGAIMNPMIAQWIEHYGWRASFRIAGGLTWGMSFLACAVLLHWDPPHVAGQPNRKQKTDAGASSQVTRRRVILLYVFALCIAFALGFSQHLPSLALDYGKTASFGARLVSASMIGSLAAKLVLGSLNDRLGAYFSTFIGLVCSVGGCGILLLNTSDVLMLIGAFFVGFILALNSMHIPLLSRTVLGVEQYDRVYPIVCSAVSLIGSMSSMVLSVFHDIAGGYRAVTTYVCTVLAVCFLATVLLQRAAGAKTAADCTLEPLNKRA